MKTALLVIDVLQRYDFDDADKLSASMEKTIEPIRTLIARAREEEVPVIYVNDHFEIRNSDPHAIAEDALSGAREDLVRPLLPEDDDVFIVKGRHSAFYHSLLEETLRAEEIERVVLVGTATEQCILYTALDAHLRRFEIAVAKDAVAHVHERLGRAALEMIEINMSGLIDEAARIDLQGPTS